MSENKQLTKEISNFKIQQKQEKEINKQMQAQNEMLENCQSEKMICKVKESKAVEYNHTAKLIPKQIKKEKSSKEFQSFTFADTSHFVGIVNYLASQIKITSSSQERPNSRFASESAIVHDDGNTYFKSADKPNSWVCLDFGPYQVIPTDYTIGSTNNGFKLKSWVVEGSANGFEYLILDVQINCKLTQPDDVILHFNIDTKKQDKFRFIRLRMIDSTWSNNNHLRLNSFEIYGKLFNE